MMLREDREERQRIFPWREGFTPVFGVCPSCGSRVTLVYTEQLTEDSHHVYHCTACGKDVGAVTFYAYCDHWEDYLEKDQFYTPCIHGACPHFVSVGPQNPTRCGHFKPVNRDTADEAFVRLIDGMKHDKLTPIPGEGPHRDRSMVQGVESDALKDRLQKMRLERLRRLEREDRK